MRGSCRSFARCTSRSCAIWNAPDAALDGAPRRHLFPLMPFRRFFDRGTKRDAAHVEEPVVDEGHVEELDAELESDAAQSDDDADYAEAESIDGAPEDAAEIDWRARALAVLPTGASTGSKRVEALYGDAEAVGPT